MSTRVEARLGLRLFRGVAARTEGSGPRGEVSVGGTRARDGGTAGPGSTKPGRSSRTLEGTLSRTGNSDRSPTTGAEAVGSTTGAGQWSARVRCVFRPSRARCTCSSTTGARVREKSHRRRGFGAPRVGRRDLRVVGLVFVRATNELKDDVVSAPRRIRNSRDPKVGTEARRAASRPIKRDHAQAPRARVALASRGGHIATLLRTKGAAGCYSTALDAIDPSRCDRSLAARRTIDADARSDC